MGELVKAGSLGSILLNSQIITEENISAALAEQKRSSCRFGEALVRLGIVAQEDIDWALSNQLNIPYVRLTRELIDRAAVELLPGSICRRYGVMPIICCGNELSVAMTDPLNIEAIAAIEELTGCTVSVSVALIRELREMQTLFYGEMKESESLGFRSELFPTAALADINTDLTGAKLIDYLLGYVVQQNLAALSLQPMGETCRILARKKRGGREIGSFPLDRLPPVQQRLRRMAGVDASVISGSGMISCHYRGSELAMQALFLSVVGGDIITIRRQILAPFPATVEDFIASDEDRRLLRELAALDRGIVLCAASDTDDRDRLIDFYLDEHGGNGQRVMLFGEGIGRGRFQFPRIEGKDLSAGDFSSLLSAILDHDPEVIAIEDAGDEHLMLGAGKAALRGKLVVAGVPGSELSTLFDYLGHLWRQHRFIPDYLAGIITCRGVLLLCPACRERYTPSSEEVTAMGLAKLPLEFFNASGCAVCGHSGVAARKYLLEVIPMSADILDCLERACDGREMVQFLNDKGLRDVRAMGITLLESGDISPPEFISALVL
ncbi:MAG: pilus assembly protein PilB [Geobacteraceae bacterium]|nr:pilus assembly protein PilB [Geobacteraceae bacterium]